MEVFVGVVPVCKYAGKMEVVEWMTAEHRNGMVVSGAPCVGYRAEATGLKFCLGLHGGKVNGTKTEKLGSDVFKIRGSIGFRSGIFT